MLHGIFLSHTVFITFLTSCANLCLHFNNCITLKYIHSVPFHSLMFNNVHVCDLKKVNLVHRVRSISAL